jgi:hypothetical protein
MNTKDFYTKLVSESSDNTLFVALRKLTLLDDPRCAFTGETATASWTMWYAADTPKLA